MQPLRFKRYRELSVDSWLTEIKPAHVAWASAAAVAFFAAARKWMRRDKAEEKVDIAYQTLLGYLQQQIEANARDMQEMRIEMTDCHRKHEECREHNLALRSRVEALEAKIERAEKRE